MTYGIENCNETLRMMQQSCKVNMNAQRRIKNDVNKGKLTTKRDTWYDGTAMLEQ